MKHVIAFLLSLSVAFPQEETPTTEAEQFDATEYGFIRIEDYYVPDLIGYNDTLECSIKRFQTLNDTTYFFQIVKKGEYSDKSASISESDLSEVLKALDLLFEESENEKTLTKIARQKAIMINRILKDSLDMTIPDVPLYLENKFVTEDGFQIGYVSGEEIIWFAKLEKYGSDDIIFFSDYDYLKTFFYRAKERIGEIKSGVESNIEKFQQWKAKMDSLESAILQLYRDKIEPPELKVFRILPYGDSMTVVAIRVINNANRDIQDLQATCIVKNAQDHIIDSKKQYVVKSSEGGLKANGRLFFDFIINTEVNSVESVELQIDNISYK